MKEGVGVKPLTERLILLHLIAATMIGVATITFAVIRVRSIPAIAVVIAGLSNVFIAGGGIIQSCYTWFRRRRR